MIRSIDDARRTTVVFLAGLGLALPLVAQPVRGVTSTSVPGLSPAGTSAQVGYRGHGNYRSYRPHQRSSQQLRSFGHRFDLSIPQPGSLLPGSYGLDAAYRQHPRAYKPRHGYHHRGAGPGYVVYVPSTGVSIDDRSPYAAQELYEAAPAPSSQIVYVMVQPPTPVAEPKASTPAPSLPVASPPPAAPVPPQSSEPSEVQLMIQPLDAVVHLDGRRLGTAAELADVDHTVLLSPGVYVLEVTHEELRSQRLVFGAQPGMPTVVEIDLQADRKTRRARLTTPEDLPIKLGSR